MTYDEAMLLYGKLVRSVAYRYHNEHSALLSFDDLVQDGLEIVFEIDRRYRKRPFEERRKLICRSVVWNLRRRIFRQYKVRETIIVDSELLLAVVDPGDFAELLTRELIETLLEVLPVIHRGVLSELLWPSRRYLWHICRRPSAILALARCFDVSRTTMMRILGEIKAVSKVLLHSYHIDEVEYLRAVILSLGVALRME